MTDSNPRRTMELEKWLDKLQERLQELAQADLAYPPGNNTVHPPVTVERLSVVASSLHLRQEVVGLYQVCDGLSLPDVHNGYFIHPIDQIQRSSQSGGPMAIDGGPYRGPIVVFGSHGGGGLFAIRAAEGDVLLLEGGAVRHSVYEDDGGRRVVKVADSFEGFLIRLLDDTAAFIEDRRGYRYMS